MKEELLRFAILNGIKTMTLQLSNGETWIFRMINSSVEEKVYQFYRKGTIPITYIK